MNRFWEKHLTKILCAGIVGFFVVAMLGIISSYEKAFDQGHSDFDVGIPALANPYQGGISYERSRRWLDGWIEAKKESEEK